MFKKVVRFFKLKFVAVFALTFFLGVLINSLSGSYWFYLTVKETFTKADADAKLNKRVVGTCFNNSEQIKATVVSYHHMNGEIFVDIKWDKPLFGNQRTIGASIDFYSHCVTETEDDN